MNKKRVRAKKLENRDVLKPCRKVKGVKVQNWKENPLFIVMWKYKRLFYNCIGEPDFGPTGDSWNNEPLGERERRRIA